MLPPVLADLFDYLDSSTGPVDLCALERMVKELKMTRNDIEDFVRFNEEGYRRNQIRLGKWYEALIICWKPGQKSYIHDHFGSSCCFRVIQGTAEEIICQPTGRVADLPLVKPVGTRVFEQGKVCASNAEHIHEVINHGDMDLITMHIYSPPLNMRIYSYDDTDSPVSKPVTTAAGTAV